MSSAAVAGSGSAGAKPRYQLFVRRDDEPLVGKTTCSGTVTLKSPARHLNYSGKEYEPWKDSGYLSLFRYDRVRHYDAGGTLKGDRSAYSVSKTVRGSYFHFVFVPVDESGHLIGMEEVALTEDTVRENLERRASKNYMLNTDQLRPPARVHAETGEVIEYARRICNEYLMVGGWPAETISITERAVEDSSFTLNLMLAGQSIEKIQACTVEPRISGYNAVAPSASSTSPESTDAGAKAMDVSGGKK